MRAHDLLLPLWLLAFAAPASAAPPPPAAPAPRVLALVPLRSFADVPFTLDPDEPHLALGGAGGRWEAMVGGQLVLFGYRGPALRLAITFPFLLELINLDSSEPVPYESWRANLGFSVLASVPALDRRLPAGGTLWAQLGFYHESDHPTAGISLRDFQDPQGTSNSVLNFSSFEYVKLRLAYEQPFARGRLRLHAGLAGRFFTPAINSGSVRALRAGFAVEVGLAVRLTERLHIWQATYFELVANDFVAAMHGFNTGADHDPLQDLRVEVGLDWRALSWVTAVPWIGFADSHGRGVLFLRRAQELTLGLRFYY